MGDELLEVFVAQPVALGATRGVMSASIIAVGNETDVHTLNDIHT